MALVTKDTRNYCSTKDSESVDGMQLVVFDDYKDEFEFVEAHPNWVYEYMDDDKKNFKRWIIAPKDKIIPAIKAMKEAFTDGAKINLREIVPERKMSIREFIQHVSSNNVNEGYFHYNPLVTVFIDFKEEEGLKMIDYSCIPF